MMKNIYTIAGTLLLLGAVLSCTREKALEPEQAGQMRFAVTVEGTTKASMTSADLNQFYLKVTGPNNAFSYFESITKDAQGNWTASRPILWKDEESSITYAAASYGALGADYFNIPVNSNLFTSGATMGLLTDQSTQAKLNAADLLTMASTDLTFAASNKGIVPITLKHGLAKVNFQLTLAAEYFDNGVGLEASPITGLALSGVHTSFFFSPLTGEVSIGASKGAVIPFQSSYEPGTEAAKPALAVAEAILVPEEFAAGALTLYFTVAGKDFQWTNSEALALAQGGEYTIPVSIDYNTVPSDPADPAGIDFSTLTADYEAKNGETLTGTLAANVKISIADGATVKLKDLTINGVNNPDYGWAGITCAGDATITLEGANTVKGFQRDYPGIYVPEGKTLTIEGEGSLNASGNGYSTGIGGGFYRNCGDIVINGGNITATGGNNNAGIGGGDGGDCGAITITGGTVTATGGDYAAGIGGGQYANCGNITISGGTVTATGGYWAAGIGGGWNNGVSGTINITSGVTQVTATKGSDDAESIGKGKDGAAITVDIQTGANVIQN